MRRREQKPGVLNFDAILETIPTEEVAPSDLNFDAMPQTLATGEAAPSDLNFDALVVTPEPGNKKPDTPLTHRKILDHDGRGDGWEEM